MSTSSTAPLNTVTFQAPSPNLVEPLTQVIGQPGLNQYWYWVIAHYPIGSTITTEAIFVGNAPNTLDADNYVLVFWNNIPGATSYDVIRTLTPAFPTSPGPYGVALGIASSPAQDNTNPPSNYDPSTFVGLPFGSPVTRLVFLNNRDYSKPTLVLPDQTNISGTLFINGAPAGVAQTPWVTDIDGGGFKLNNVSQIHGTTNFNLVIASPSLDIDLDVGTNRAVNISGNASVGGALTTSGALRTNGGLEVLTGAIMVVSMPTADPGPGSNQLWADPADGNRVKWSA